MFKRILSGKPQWHVAGNAALVLLVFLAFGHSLLQDFAPIDDTLLVRENLAIRGISWSNLRYVFTHYDPELYIPLTFVSFQINYLFGGLDPFGFHFGNILLHAVNAVLVHVFLKKLMCRSRSGEPRLSAASHSTAEAAAFVGAVIFAVHPLHTEAVVWIAGRKDLLFTFFYLLTLIVYVEGKSRSRSSSVWYCASIVFAALAMLSKATAMTLPIVLILVDGYLHAVEHRGSPLRQRSVILHKIPFLLLSVACALIALGGKERVVGSTTLLETVAVALRSTAHYVWQFLVPYGFSVFYEQREPVVDFHVALSLVLSIAVLFWAWRKRRSHPSILFGLLFYLITLSPTFLNFHKGLISFYAVDRYAYLPSVGLCIVLATLLRSRRSASMILCAAAIILLVLSRYQSRVWDSPETLYRHAISVDPPSVPARTTLAQVLRQMHRTIEAFEVLREGLQFGDDVSYRLEAEISMQQTVRLLMPLGNSLKLPR